MLRWDSPFKGLLWLLQLFEFNLRLLKADYLFGRDKKRKLREKKQFSKQSVPSSTYRTYRRPVFTRKLYNAVWFLTCNELIYKFYLCKKMLVSLFV